MDKNLVCKSHPQVYFSFNHSFTWQGYCYGRNYFQYYFLLNLLTDKSALYKDRGKTVTGFESCILKNHVLYVIIIIIVLRIIT